jgi:hypothetical protein
MERSRWSLVVFEFYLRKLGKGIEMNDLDAHGCI